MNQFAASALKTATKQANKTTTTNGMKAFNATLNYNLDFFGKSGELKYPDALADFQLAYGEDPQLALRNLLQTRDIRGGKGVRNTVQEILTWLATTHTSVVTGSNLLEKIIEVGYWKDLFQLVDNTSVPLVVKQRVIAQVARSLEDVAQQGLVAKWLPLKGSVPSMLRSYLKLTPKQLRQKVVELRKEVTERKMCEKRWVDIEYSHVPSICMKRNKNSFFNNDLDRFTSFLESVNKGEVKLNASTLYPHDVTIPYRSATMVDSYRRRTSITEDALAEAQWKNLPNWLEGKKQGILPVVDLSGSMNTPIGIGSSMTYAHIAVTLAAYISERTEGPFRDLITTFADSPAFVNLQGSTSLLDRIQRINRGRVGYSTNIHGTFKLLLDHAVANKVPQEDMPEMLLFLSDTQFNYSENEKRAYKLCRQMFKDAGYEAPKLIFWVLNAAGNSNVPVKFDDKDSALVSGFSPSILKGLLTDLEKYTPLNVMLETLNDPRYTVTYY